MGRVLRILELRTGEGAAFGRAFAVIALTIAGHTLLETARDALFLESLPPAFLTLVYVAVALGALVVSPLSTRLTASAGARNALCFTLVVTAFGAAWFRYQPASPPLVFALYVFGALTATTLVAEFWLLLVPQTDLKMGVLPHSIPALLFWERELECCSGDVRSVRMNYVIRLKRHKLEASLLAFHSCAREERQAQFFAGRFY